MTLVNKNSTGSIIHESETFYSSSDKDRISFYEASEDPNLHACLVTDSGQIKLHNTSCIMLPSWIA